MGIKRTLHILCCSLVLPFFDTVQKTNVVAIAAGTEGVTRAGLPVTPSGGFWKLLLGHASGSLTCDQ